MEFTFRVTIRPIARCSKSEALEYVRQAIRAYGGGGHPDSPFFGLRDEDVEVIPVKEMFKSGS